jgi:hypothetical protein
MRIHKVRCEVCSRRLGVAEEWAPGSADGRFRCMKCATETTASEADATVESAKSKRREDGPPNAS